MKIELRANEPKCANWFLILLGILTIWILGLGLVFFVLSFLRVKATEYFITSYRIYAKYGLIRRRVFEIKNEWITGVTVKQGFIPRILNYGDIIYSTPGQYAGSVMIAGISDPMHLRTIVEDVLRKFRERQVIQNELKALEREFELERIDKLKYEELRRRYEEKIKLFE